jgi:hypothetical protein
MRCVDTAVFFIRPRGVDASEQDACRHGVLVKLPTELDYQSDKETSQ